MPDPTTDPIRAACVAAAREMYDQLAETMADMDDSCIDLIARHLRGPLTDRERTALEALRFYANRPNHYDARGTCGESDVFQDGGDRARAALRLYDAP